jgi:DNA polymerase-1
VKDRPRLAELFKDHGFRTFYREMTEGEDAPVSSPAPLDAPAASVGQTDDLFAMADAAPAPAPVAPPASAISRHYHTILDDAALQGWLDKLGSGALVSLDTETTSLDQMQARIVGISFALQAGEAAYLPLGHHYAGVPQQLALDDVLAKLKPWLEDASKPKCGQNLKYDRHVFANRHPAAAVADDSMLASYVLESHQRHNMDDLAARHLGETTVSYEDICGKGAKQIGFGEVDIEIAANYRRKMPTSPCG